MVTMSDADFFYLFATLRRANEPYSHEEAGEIVEMERQSWYIVERIAEEQGLDLKDSAGQPD